MGFVEALLAALAAIPELLKEIRNIRNEMQKANVLQIQAAMAKASQDAGKATTDDEYTAAAKEINEALNKL